MSDSKRSLIEELEAARVHKGISVLDLCRTLEIAPATYYVWKKKNAIPRIEKDRVKNFITGLPLPKKTISDSFLQALVDKWQQLSVEEKARTIIFVDSLLHTHKK